MILFDTISPLKYLDAMDTVDTQSVGVCYREEVFVWFENNKFDFYSNFSYSTKCFLKVGWIDFLERSGQKMNAWLLAEGIQSWSRIGLCDMWKDFESVYGVHCYALLLTLCSFIETDCEKDFCYASRIPFCVSAEKISILF